LAVFTEGPAKNLGTSRRSTRLRRGREKEKRDDIGDPDGIRGPYGEGGWKFKKSRTQKGGRGVHGSKRGPCRKVPYGEKVRGGELQEGGKSLKNGSRGKNWPRRKQGYTSFKENLLNMEAGTTF